MDRWDGGLGVNAPHSPALSPGEKERIPFLPANSDDKKGNLFNQMIRGFTIVEVTVVMIIAGIVVSMAMAVYLNIQKYYLKSKKETGYRTDMQMLNMALECDFERARAITFDGSYLHINGVETEYDLDSVVVRTFAQHSDTFRIKITGVNTEAMADFPELVRMLKLDMLCNGDEYSAVYEKRYEDVDLFGRELASSPGPISRGEGKENP